MTTGDELAEARANETYRRIHDLSADLAEARAERERFDRDRAKNALAFAAVSVERDAARAEYAALKAAVEGDVEKLRGDVHHLVSPIIGKLRLIESPDHRERHEPLFWEYLSHTIERLYLVLGLVDEAATGQRASDEIRGRHGVGLNHYPALAAAVPTPTDEEQR